MSLDLYQSETADRLATMPPVRVPEVGAWDGFIRGAGLTTMRNLARVGRSIDMAGAVGPIAQDAFTGGTVAQDKYFKEHDDVWGSAVDAWTPKPNEVGVAGQITGEVLSMLPLVIASPHLAIGATQLGSAEDLMRQGVDSGKAQAVGAVQGAGLGLGIWLPILGQNLWQRVVVGGAGANVLQGVGTRAASGMILEGEKAAEEFKAFDGEALTLDVLMGMAFGGLVHMSPAARAQGAEAWNRISAWAEGLSPTEKAAIVSLRLAQHLNVDSTPGRPATPLDVEAHVNRVRTAIEQLERGQPVEVQDIGAPRFDAEPVKVKEETRHADQLVSQAERVRKAEGIAEITEPAAQEPRLAPTIETEAPAGQPRGAEPPPPRGPSEGKPAGAEANAKTLDPIAREADRMALAQPDRVIRIGTDPEGMPITKTAKQYLEDARLAADDARKDVSLFEAAAQCLLGRA